MLANTPQRQDRNKGRSLRKTYLAAAVRITGAPGALRGGISAIPKINPILAAALCVLAALVAVCAISAIHATAAYAQVGEITGAIDRATADIVTIGLTIAVLMLAIGFIMMMWPGTNERVKGAGMKVIVCAGIGLAGLGLLAALSGMIEGWSGGGGGGGGN